MTMIPAHGEYTMTEHTPLDIATIRRDAKAGYDSPDPDVSILARDCFVLLARLEQAEQERDELRAALAITDDAYARIGGMNYRSLDAQRRILAERDALRQQVAAARKALAEYGGHFNNCAVAGLEHMKEHPACTCGLDAAIAAAQETPDV